MSLKQHIRKTQNITNLFFNQNYFCTSEGEQVELYPWQSEICKDYDEESCTAFKPMCSIMGVIAHKKCRKTCKLCLQDKPKPRSKLK